ncbi:MAG: aldo/keto reductase, partial [Anaerolineales bacterium]|nr:aldo/keto reductase [Anaerolineales bacterium]
MAALRERGMFAHVRSQGLYRAAVRVVLPEGREAIWDSDGRGRTPVEWGFDWLWNKPQVTVALSGMSTMQQVVENIASAEHSQPHNLTADELALVRRVRDAYFSLGT